MPYATLTQLRSRLPQADLNQAMTNALTEYLGEASSIVDGALGLSFLPAGSTWASVAPTTKTVRSERSTWLRLPPYQEGSITLLVQRGTTLPITDYEEQWSAGRHYLWRETGWLGLRYDVTATFGYGPAPASLVELELELAVNIFRAKDKGMFTEIVGVEGGGGLRYIGGLNKQQQMIIANVRRQYIDGVH